MRLKRRLVQLETRQLPQSWGIIYFDARHTPAQAVIDEALAKTPAGYETVVVRQQSDFRESGKVALIIKPEYWNLL